MAAVTRLGLAAIPRGLYGSFAGKTEEEVVTIPGIEFTLSPNRLHFTMPGNRLHFTLPVDRLHYRISEE